MGRRETGLEGRKTGDLSRGSEHACEPRANGKKARRGRGGVLGHCESGLLRCRPLASSLACPAAQSPACLFDQIRERILTFYTSARARDMQCIALAYSPLHIDAEHPLLASPTRSLWIQAPPEGPGDLRSSPVSVRVRKSYARGCSATHDGWSVRGTHTDWRNRPTRTWCACSRVRPFWASSCSKTRSKMYGPRPARTAGRSQ